MHDNEIRGIQALASDLRSKLDTIINDLEDTYNELENKDDLGLAHLEISIKELKELI